MSTSKPTQAEQDASDAEWTTAGADITPVAEPAADPVVAKYDADIVDARGNTKIPDLAFLGTKPTVSFPDAWVPWVAAAYTKGYEKATPQAQAVARNVCRLAVGIPVERTPDELDVINARRARERKPEINASQIDD